MTNVQLSEAEIAAISGLLKSARESRGDNLAEAAFKIALSPSQLRAIEAGDLQPFYSTGYYLQAVDRYANYLGVTLPPRVPPATEVPEAVAQEAPESDAVASDAVPSDAAPSDALVAEMPTTVSTVMEAEPKKVGISELPSERESRTVPWGWIAFAIAGLITIGVLKESLEPAAVPAPTANDSAASNAATNENKPTDSAAAPSNESAATTTTTAPVATAPQAPASPAQKAATSAPLVTTGTSSAASSTVTSATASDGVLEVQGSTWVQIVKNNGEKTNIKVEPGQRVEFPSSSTAAVVFGQPEKARLTIKGKPVNLSPFITQDSPPRGLVIISQIRD
jgi:transcriptional regulator with XRE-family HTH domain